MSKQRTSSKINIMNKIFFEHNRKDPKKRGVPIMGRLCYTNTFEPYSCTFLTNKVDTGEPGKPGTTHCETRMVRGIEEIIEDEEVDLYVTLSPCKDCQKEINKIDRIKNVYFLIENTGSEKNKTDFSDIKVKQYRKLISDSDLNDSKVQKLISDEDFLSVCNEIIIYQNNKYIRRFENKTVNVLKELTYHPSTMSVELNIIKVREK